MGDKRVNARAVCGVLFGGLMLLISLRMGIEVPLISHFARSLQAEREKTYQLEEIVRWWNTSEYRQRALTFYRTARNPADSSLDLGDRRFRPPTYQSYLDVYTRRARLGATGASCPLLVTFGDDEIVGLSPIKTVSGRWAGVARVYRESGTTECQHLSVGGAP